MPRHERTVHGQGGKHEQEELEPGGAPRREPAGGAVHAVRAGPGGGAGVCEQRLDGVCRRDGREPDRAI